MRQVLLNFMQACCGNAVPPAAAASAPAAVVGPVTTPAAAAAAAVTAGSDFTGNGATSSHLAANPQTATTAGSSTQPMECSASHTNAQAATATAATAAKPCCQVVVWGAGYDTAWFQLTKEDCVWLQQTRYIEVDFPEVRQAPLQKVDCAQLHCFQVWLAVGMCAGGEVRQLNQSRPCNTHISADKHGRAQRVLIMHMHLGLSVARATQALATNSTSDKQQMASTAAHLGLLLTHSHKDVHSTPFGTCNVCRWLQRSLDSS